MKHITIVLCDTDTEPHRVKISHGKKNFLTDEDTREDVLAKDINTLSSGLIMLIREGREKGIINGYQTIENLINYFKANQGIIDTEGMSMEGFEKIEGTILRK